MNYLNFFIKKFLSFYLKRRSDNSYKKIQKAKLEILKRNGLYKRFPYDLRKPAIEAYGLSTKIDKYYFDFFYSVTLKPDPDYIPATSYLNYIEPELNDIRFIKSIGNKALYDRFLFGIKTPVTILRKIDGFYYDSNYCEINLTESWLKTLSATFDKIILKPSVESGGGQKIALFERLGDKFVRDEKVLNLSELVSFPDFVIQEVIVQHPFFKRFNPACNNTIRILTYRSVRSNKTQILHCLLRIGKLGHFTDHDNLGGIVVGISKDGTLNKFGCDSNGLKTNSYNGVDFSPDIKVPYIDESKTMALAIADQIFYARLLAIDITVDKNGMPNLLEINCHGNGTCQYQLNNGSLFKEFTNEVLEYCARNKLVEKSS